APKSWSRHKSQAMSLARRMTKRRKTGKLGTGIWKSRRTNAGDGRMVMPVTVHAEVRRLTEDEFSDVAYKVMGHVFAVHSEFGRFFREEIYHQEIARRCGGIAKAPIEVCHAGFRKFY